MFTGIVESMGSVARLMRRGGGARLEVRAPQTASAVKVGDSVAVNGSCVTVTETNGEVFACDLVPETVARTNLGILHVGESVNIEMPMQAGSLFGGHIVQGHVDCVGTVRSRRKAGAQEMLEVNVPFEITRYIAPQGSVAVDGVSLTVVGVDKDRFRVALIPHTVSVTTLGQKGQGAAVNVEVDVLSKYVERHLQVRRQPSPFQIKAPEEAADERAAETAVPKPRSAARASAKAPSKPQERRTPSSKPASSKAASGKAVPPRTPVKKTKTAKKTTKTKSRRATLQAKTAKRTARPARAKRGATRRRR